MRITLVPTPIGNLEDITLRALRTLKEAHLIAAEDTRTSSKLLSHYEIKTPLTSLHMHNEHHKVQQILDKVVNENLNLAVISDAGTPGISDPGFLIVREAIKRGLFVETLPGATAFVPALVNSGFPCDSFVFEGFLPVKKGRHTRLQLLATETRTIIFYESPYKLLKTLEDLKEIYGGREYAQASTESQNSLPTGRLVSVSRELTKIHEETVRGTFDEVIQHYKNGTIKGEIVIVVAAQ